MDWIDLGLESSSATRAVFQKPRLFPTQPTAAPRELQQSASTLQQITNFADRFWGELTELQRELLKVFAKLRGGDLPPEFTPARWRWHEAPPGTMPDRQP